MTSARGGGPSGTTVLCTASALVAFAANSVLCRLALGRAEIDAASFSTIRLASGAFALLLLSLGLRGRSLRIGGNWGSAALLFLYAWGSPKTGSRALHVRATTAGATTW